VRGRRGRHWGRHKENLERQGKKSSRSTIIKTLKRLFGKGKGVIEEKNSRVGVGKPVGT